MNEINKTEQDLLLCTLEEKLRIATDALELISLGGSNAALLTVMALSAVREIEEIDELTEQA